MFTGNEDMEATALREQGWSISAIARHLGRDRATVRNHLNGTRVAGERRRSEPDAVRGVRALPARAPARGPARVGDRPLRRGRAPSASSSRTRASREGFARRELRPHCEACAGVKGTGHHRDRAPAGRGDPVGLGRAARGSLGRRRPPARSARCRARGKFRGVFCRVRGPAAPHRGDRRRAAAPRRQRPALADRSHGDGRRPEDRRDPAELRPGGQALRRERRRLPAATGQPEGLGGEVHPLRHPALLAHDDGRHHGPGDRSSSTGSASASPIAGPGRSPSWRSSSAKTPPRRSSRPADDGARRWRTWPSSSGCGRFPPPATRRPSRTTTGWGPRLSFPSRATPTRCLPG